MHKSPKKQCAHAELNNNGVGGRFPYHGGEEEKAIDGRSRFDRSCVGGASVIAPPFGEVECKRRRSTFGFSCASVDGTTGG